MKAIILLAVFAFSEAASVVFKHPTAHVPATSAFQTQDVAGNYAFGYHDGRPNVATFHSESGSAGAKVGSYGLSSADGKVRIVDYIADQGGFRAKIKTNEEEIPKKNPADVTIEEAKVKNLVPVVPYHPYPAGYPVAAPAYGYVVYNPYNQWVAN